jgi:hypothetical protein
MTINIITYYDHLLQQKRPWPAITTCINNHAINIYSAIKSTKDAEPRWHITILGNGHKKTGQESPLNYLTLPLVDIFLVWSSFHSHRVLLPYSCQYVAKDGGTFGDATLIVIELGGAKNGGVASFSPFR